ncbi:hypothetical protein AAMO2058_000091700 [Amorphochlora amoebiformis]
MGMTGDIHIFGPYARGPLAGKLVRKNEKKAGFGASCAKMDQADRKYPITVVNLCANGKGTYLLSKGTAEVKTLSSPDLSNHLTSLRVYPTLLV